jgi:hypothetical protein
MIPYHNPLPSGLHKRKAAFFIRIFTWPPCHGRSLPRSSMMQFERLSRHQVYF